VVFGSASSTLTRAATGIETNSIPANPFPWMPQILPLRWPGGGGLQGRGGYPFLIAMGSREVDRVLAARRGPQGAADYAAAIDVLPSEAESGWGGTQEVLCVAAIGNAYWERERLSFRARARRAVSMDSLSWEEITTRRSPDASSRTRSNTSM